MIVVESLTKRYGRTRAVDGLSFTARPGRVTALLGPNGAGKTTTLRALLGLARPTAGSATVDGRPYAELADPCRTVGAVLEVHTFHPWRSARAHLRALAYGAGLAEDRVETTLRRVGLADDADRRVGGYSYGMRQRLSLAAALLGDPGVLILDEPQNGLDPQATRWLRELLRSLAAGGRTVLISSHLLAEMSEVADDVVVVDSGRLVRQAPLAELLAQTGESVRVASPDAERFAKVLAAGGMPADPVGDGRLLVRGRAPAVGSLAAEHGVTLHELTPQRSGLEDVYLALTGEQGED
ncbi:MAG: ABC transporter ATP-binding protein [Streptosporangiaceae bacterium]